MANAGVIILRYLTKEVFITLLAITGVLLLVFMSNQMIVYMNRAANGQIPILFVLKLLLYEIPLLLGLLLPLGFYVALILAYGRLYVDSEMIVLQACGFGPFQLLQRSLLLAGVIGLVVLWFSMGVIPKIADLRRHVLQTTGVKLFVKTIMPARFNMIPGGDQVLYVQSLNAAHTKGQRVFIARNLPQADGQHWDIMTAKTAELHHDNQLHEDEAVLHEGTLYQGIPGQVKAKMVEFKQFNMRLPRPRWVAKQDIRAMSTRRLLQQKATDCRAAAEWQWRWSIPLMTLCLTCVAVPLSRVNPRSGKFAKMLPAVVTYIIYANFMFMMRNAIYQGKLSPWLGLGWLHLLVALFGLSLLSYQQRSPS